MACGGGEGGRLSISFYFVPPRLPLLDSSPPSCLYTDHAWPWFFLPSRLCPQPTNLLIGSYLRPNEVLLYWDNFSKSVTCRQRLHLTFSLINGEPLTGWAMAMCTVHVNSLSPCWLRGASSAQMKEGEWLPSALPSGRLLGSTGLLWERAWKLDRRGHGFGVGRLCQAA